MNNHNLNIDDFFKEARNQPPVFSKDEARNLLENRAEKGSAYSNFKIRNLRGVRHMNILIASLATAGAISFFALNPYFEFDSSADDNKVKKPKQQLLASTQDNVRQPESNEVRKIDEQNKKEGIKVFQRVIVIDDDKKVTLPSPDIAPPDPLLISENRVDIKGITVIDIEEKNLADLGLQRVDDGLKLWVNVEGEDPMLCTLLVKGGLVMKTNSTEKVEEFVPKIHPRLITDNEGNKRIEFDDNIIRANYISSTMTENPENKKIEKLINKNHIMISSFDNDKNSNPGISINAQDDKKMIIIMDDSSKKKKNSWSFPDNDFWKKHGNMLPPDFKWSDSTLNLPGNQHFWFHYEIDSNLKKHLNELHERLKKFNLEGKMNYLVKPPFPHDAQGKEAREIERQARELEKQARELDRQARDLDRQARKLESDASNTNKDELLNKADELRSQSDDIRDKATDLRDKAWELRDKTLNDIDIFMDTMNMDFDFDFDFDFDGMDSDSAKDINLNDIINNIHIQVNRNLDPIMSRINLMEDNVNNFVKVNKLIPVAIPMGKNPDINIYNDKEDFAFIAWYEPTPEVLQALPEKVRSRLEPEINALATAKDICFDAPVKAEEAYFDIWRSCSGAVENLTVFPNPSSGFINLKYGLTQSRNIEISLHDLKGKKIRLLSQFETCPAGMFERKFELQDLQPGMYLVSVQTDKNEQAVQRVIIEE